MYPKIVYNTLKKCKDENIKFALEMQAFEFYMFEPHDLFDKKNPVEFHDFGTEYGATRLRIKEFSDLGPLLEKVNKNRSSGQTKLNIASEEHGGSSRSHCALVLTLYRRKEDKYIKTYFVMCDLAGAERPGKADVERKTAYECLIDFYTHGKCDVANQTTVINYELS